MEKYFLYHIARPNSNLEEGYIGITNNPNRRWLEHKKSNYKVGRAIRKYPDIEMIILVEGAEDYILELEEKLRPQPDIGYNIAAGGGRPQATAQDGSNNNFFGKHHTDDTKQKLSENRLGTKHWNSKLADIYDASTDCIVAKGVSIREWCRENNNHQSNLSATARGIKKTSKGYYARYIEE